MMAYRWLAAPFLLTFAVLGIARAHAQMNEAAQIANAAAPPAPRQMIVSKDPLYLKLLNPPQGNDFLQTYSQAYRDVSVEIDSKVAGISEEALQRQARDEEWASVLKRDGDKFRYEAEVTFRDAKIAFAQSHKDEWFDAGRVFYEENNSVLVVVTNPTTPIAANLRLPTKISALNQVYAKFHQIAAQEIDQKAREYVASSGAGSNCSRNPDWCLSFAKQDIEQRLRSQRIVVVAQGDLETSRMDRLILVDYDTEAVLLRLDAPASALTSAAWRFSVGPVPVAPEPALTEVHVQSATAEAVTAPVRVPGNVTAASIIQRTPPEYPAQARARLIQGEVLLHAIIAKDGKISQAQVLSGDDLLAQPALEAVRQWRYKPMLVDGEAREVDTTITVTFSLKD